MSTTSFPLVVLEESLMDGGGPGHPWLRAAALERSCGPGLSHPDVPWGAAARPLVPQGSGLSGVVGVVCCGPLTVMVGVLCVRCRLIVFLPLSDSCHCVLAAV